MSEPNPFDGLVGRVFEKRYRILEPLGEGGMGAVFLGEHVVIGRQVAIKVLHSRLAESQDFADRFVREAIAAGRLAHPNCVPVTDSGQLEDGTAYMVMELVKGVSLGDLLEDQGPQLEPVRALRIARDVLRGLGHAHKMGIVHRDIKPDNIMLTVRDDNPDFARVLDFGIAKLRDEENKETQALTQAGMSVGTPTYLSPEQAMGEEVDHRSDLYSAAVVLFEMLTGRAPYVAANPVGILTKHASSPIPHLWDVAENLANRGELDALLQRGLAKLREERFASAAEFIEAIDLALTNLGAVLTPPPLTGDFAALDPNLAQSYARAQTGPPLPQELHRASTAQPYRAATGPPHRASTEPPHRASTEPPHRASTEPPPAREVSNGHPTVWGGRHVIAAAILVALLGAGVWLASGSSGEAGTTLSGLSSDELLDRYTTTLTTAKTCKERLGAVKALEVLNDKRALPELKRARKRMRGGTLGFGKKNSNRCLRKAAQRAIDKLSN